MPSDSRLSFRKKFFAFLGIAILGTALSFSTISVVSTLSSPVEVLADSGTPQSEEAVEASRISFTLTTAAATETSQSYRCMIKSTRIQAISNSARYNNVYTVVEDENWPGTFKDALELATAAKAEAEAKGEEFVIPHYKGTVYNISNSRAANSDIVLPSQITYSNNLIIDVVKVGANVCFNRSTLETSYANITSITIPNTITAIAENAFAGASDAGIPVRVQAADDTGFEEGWTDGEVVYNYEIAENDSHLRVNGPTPIYFGTGENFVVGIKNENYDLPLRLEYALLDASGSKGQTQYLDLPIRSSVNSFDAVGSDMGSTELDVSIDITVPKGYTVDHDSIVFHNVYLASLNGTGIALDLEHPFYAVPKKSYKTALRFDEFFSYSAGSLTSFGNFTRVGLNLHKNLDVYARAVPARYEQYEDLIKDGTYAIRHQFTSINQANYRILYREGNEIKEKTIRVSTPIIYSLVEGDDVEMGFLINNEDVGPGFNVDSLVEIDLQAFVVKVDLMNVEKKSLLNKSEFTIRFASLVLLSNEIAPTARHNLTLVTVLTFVIYGIVYAGIAVGYYFYAKEKFKNDEFRRMKGKAYVKEAIKNGVGIGLIVGAVFFIIARWGFFNGDVVTYNPIDIFVILFTISGAIYLGFAIKGIVTSVKNNNQRKKAARLHLDQDQEDDGTK